MRKIIIVLATLLLFISACANESDHEQKQNDEDNEENLKEEEISENDQEKDLEMNNDDNNNQTENEPSNEKVDFAPEYQIADNWAIIPMKESTNEQAVLLTIDDAPDDHALDMAQTLKDLDAPAIFFVNGHFLETNEEKEILQEIHEMGFMIGNHTYSHANLSELTKEEQKEEIEQVSEMVSDIIGERPQFFRPPFGVYTDYTKEVIHENEMVYMNWTYGYDWEEDYMTEEAIADIMVNAEELGNGGNLLMHDREWTAAALADIVTGLRDQGYEMIDPALIETVDVVE